MNRHQRRAAAAQARDAAPASNVIPLNQPLQGRATDGFQNLVLKIGEGSTVMRGGYTMTGLTKQWPLLDSMYRGSWIVGQVVDAVAEDMTRAGVSLMGIPQEESKVLQRKMTRMSIWQALTQNIKWGRLYGGSIAVIMIDGQDLSTPLDPDTIKKGQFTGLKIFDRWSANPSANYKIMEGPDLGLPEYYNITRLGLNIHHSRCIRSIGIELPFYESEREEFWGESVVERLYDRILPFDTATASAAQLLTKSYLRTVQVENLREILAQGGVAEENLIKMFALMGKLQSTEGITLLDKADEFETHSYTFSGIEGILTQFAQQLSGACGIPLVRLLGQSPAGMNSTGESDMRMYHENIDQQRESRLRLGLQRVLDINYRSTFGKPPPEDFDFEFNPLKQLDAKEKAETGEKMTKTVVEAYAEDLIDRPTAMRELSYIGTITGLFNNITEEMIDEADALVAEAKADPSGELDPATGLPKPPPPMIGEPPKPGDDGKQKAAQ